MVDSVWTRVIVFNACVKKDSKEHSVNFQLEFHQMEQRTHAIRILVKMEELVKTSMVQHSVCVLKVLADHHVNFLLVPDHLEVRVNCQREARTNAIQTHVLTEVHAVKMVVATTVLAYLNTAVLIVKLTSARSVTSMQSVSVATVAVGLDTLVMDTNVKKKRNVMDAVRTLIV